MKEYRFTNGFDIHKFYFNKDAEHQFITLGGIKIPHNKSILAHSDGDVILHSLCDAILGAFSMGDIGNFFPDTDENWKDMDSSFFVNKILSKVSGKIEIKFIDITIFAEAPKIAPHKSDIRNNIAKLLNINIDRVSLKATTTEKCGFIGREEAICATVSLTSIIDTNIT